MMNNNKTNLDDTQKNRLIPIVIILLAIGYAIFYFNYMATPTEDFISNFRQTVLNIYAGKYPGGNYTIMPVFPLLLALLTKINPFSFSHDAIYDTAILLNILLFVPYILLVYKIFQRFLNKQVALAALLFLSVNINTPYTAVNAELEMLMTLLAVTAIWLSINDSKLAYIASFFASGIKYDAVFAIPAVMFRDFFHKRQKIITLILGGLSATGVISWIILSIFYGNSYVTEIANRGPNIYMFPIDCVLTATGFVPWMAMHGYDSAEYYIKIPLYIISAIFILFVLMILVKGIILITRQRWREAAPLMIFFSGFMLVHMIYQNTKSRYVLPILCFFYLFMFYGLSASSPVPVKWLQFYKSMAANGIITRILTFLAGLMYIAGAAAILGYISGTHFIFALAFAAALGLIVFTGNNGWSGWKKTILVLIGGIIINFSIFYGVRTMDHYSYRRVEFKEAALWYSANSGINDRMLISITDVPVYYTGLPAERFIGAVEIKSTTLKDLIKELQIQKVTYVFVDDFYIRRYKIKDPNAIEKKAWLFQAVRDNGEATKHFRLLTTFEPRKGIKGYMFRFLP